MLSKKNNEIELEQSVGQHGCLTVRCSEIFSRVMAKMKIHIGSEAFNSWFSKLDFVTQDGVVVKISTPTAFLKSWIHSHYADLLLKLWQNEDSAILRIELLVRASEKSERLPSATAVVVKADFAKAYAATPITSSPRKCLAVGSPLDMRYNFESFVEGASNRLALAAARTVAEAGHDHAQLNPLFLHSDVGLGKTHLLQAIAAKAQAGKYYGNTVYLTAEYFMWRFATAIRDNNALSLKEQLRDINLLIIDDLQFLQGKSIQNEFCHLLNMLLDSAKKIVVAADRPPAELESLDPRVRSRLQGGVTIAIDYPDAGMRFKMLQNKLRMAQRSKPHLHIDEDKLWHIANNLQGSGRDLEGVFNQVLFRQSFEGELSIAKLDEVLGTMSQASEPKRVRIEDIQRIVARHYSLSKQDLLSSRRIRAIVKPRQVAMYLAKSLTLRSLPEIGRRFGGRDHTTVLHAVRKIEACLADDNALVQELQLLKHLINECVL